VGARGAAPGTRCTSKRSPNVESRREGAADQPAMSVDDWFPTPSRFPEPLLAAAITSRPCGVSQ